MWPILGAAAISAFGSMASSGIGAWSASAADKRSYKYSKRLFDYQLRRNLVDAPAMQMEGYRNAGINPVVAYGNLGANQSMPMFNANVPEYDLGLDKAVQTYMSARQLSKENERADKKLEQDLKLINAEVNSAKSNADLNSANAELARAKADKERNTTPSAKSYLDEREKSLRMIEATIRKYNAERWQGMKTSMTIRTPRLAEALGVRMGGTIYLGDALDLLHSMISDEGEIRQYITENIKLGGLKSKPKSAKPAPKPAEPQTGDKDHDGPGMRDGKLGYWRGGYWYPQNVWKRMKR